MIEKYNDVLTVSDLCEILNIGRNSAYKMLKSREIPSKKVRHKYIIPKQGLINYLNSISSIHQRESVLKISSSNDIIKP